MRDHTLFEVYKKFSEAGENAVGKILKQLPSHLHIFVWKVQRCKTGDELAYRNQFHCLISVSSADIPHVFEKRGSMVAVRL